MLLTALVIVAAVSVVLGLVLPSVPWLIASLVASVLAAFFLYRSWGSIKERRTNMARRKKPAESVASPAPAPPPPSPASPPAAPPVTGGPDDVWVVDGRPAYHRSGCPVLAGQHGEPIPLAQALEDGFTACPACAASTRAAAEPPARAAASTDRQVWVADGYPEYHHQGCEELTGLTAEPVPYDQAVEDGFQPCIVCNPDRDFGGPPAGPAAQGWVVDGEPDYHRADCGRLAGQRAEAVPRGQALEDGFAACAVCDPDAAAEASPAPARPAAAPPVAEAAPLGAPVEVWVADGFPYFHSAGCRELNGLDSEAIALEQALEDGFVPCAVCAPDRAASAGPADAVRAAPVAAREVWVVDGLPDYHRQSCHELVDLD